MISINNMLNLDPSKCVFMVVGLLVVCALNLDTEHKKTMYMYIGIISLIIVSIIMLMYFMNTINSSNNMDNSDYYYVN